MRDRKERGRVIIMELSDEQSAISFNPMERNPGLGSDIRRIFRMMKGMEEVFGCKIPMFQVLWRKALVSMMEASLEKLEKVGNQDSESSRRLRKEAGAACKAARDIEEKGDNAFDNAVEAIDSLMETLLDRLTEMDLVSNTLGSLG